MKRKGFYKYFLYVIVFGLVGTIINFVLVAPLTYLFNNMGFFYVSAVGDEFKHKAEENPDFFN